MHHFFLEISWGAFVIWLPTEFGLSWASLANAFYRPHTLPAAAASAAACWYLPAAAVGGGGVATTAASVVVVVVIAQLAERKIL